MLADSCPRGRTPGQLPARCVLHRQNPEGSQACGPARRAAEEIRIGDQSENGQADRISNSAQCIGSSRSSDPMKPKFSILDFGFSIDKSGSKQILCFALCAMLFALSFPVGAQQATKIPRIGYLTGSSLAANPARTDEDRVSRDSSSRSPSRSANDGAGRFAMPNDPNQPTVNQLNTQGTRDVVGGAWSELSAHHAGHLWSNLSLVLGRRPPRRPSDPSPSGESFQTIRL